MADASSISRAFKGTKTGNAYLVRCPVATHGKGKGDRNPSLLISDRDDGGIRANCLAGCDWRDIFDALRRRGLLDDRAPSRDAAPVRRCEPVESPIEPDPKALTLWRSAEASADTLAHRYLRARVGTIDPPPSLRFLPASEYLPRIILPAMIAGLQAPDRRVIAVQITFLDPRGDRKAQGATPRKTIGKMHGGAVRLGPAGDVLGIAEGVETALAAMQLTGIPCWACLGSQRMARVAIPDSVRELHLFGDNDEPGRLAVEQAAKAHAHRRVVVRFPPDGFGDYADLAADIAKRGVAA
ncbi:MAG: toprim domain-containing protein [Methylocystis sp.]